MTCLLRWCMEMETRCRIPIWRTFGRIQWHVIPEPRITLQGAATWWIHCHDSRATCHIAGCKNSIRHIENRFSPCFFLFLMQFRLWRAAACVSSPMHLFNSACYSCALHWQQLWTLYWIWSYCCAAPEQIKLLYLAGGETHLEFNKKSAAREDLTVQSESVVLLRASQSHEDKSISWRCCD